eukprot:g2469.t1
MSCHLLILLLLAVSIPFTSATIGPGPKKARSLLDSNTQGSTYHYDTAMLRYAMIEEEERENKGGKAPKPPCGKCKKAPKAAKTTVPKPPTPDGVQPIIPTEADLMVMGRKPDDFVRSWVPPFTKRELYQDNQYTLSGSIYESARNGVCTNLAEMMGVCPWPCQERGANDGSEKYRPKWMRIVEKIPPYDRLDPNSPCLVESAHPPWPDRVNSKSGAASKPGATPGKASSSGATTSEGPFGVKYKETQCICVDPCSTYKTCQECTLIKRSYTGLPRLVGVSPWNCAWCEDRCVSANAMGPMLFQECSGRYSYTYSQCGPTITPEEIALPGPYEEPPQEDGGSAEQDEAGGGGDRFAASQVVVVENSHEDKVADLMNLPDEEKMDLDKFLSLSETISDDVPHKRMRKK